MQLLITSAPLLARGAATTVYLSVIAILLSTVLGLLFALAQLYGGVVVRIVVEVYLYFVRGVPLLVLLFAMYYALPYAGIALEPLGELFDRVGGAGRGQDQNLARKVGFIGGQATACDRGN